MVRKLLRIDLLEQVQAYDSLSISSLCLCLLQTMKETLEHCEEAPADRGLMENFRDLVVSSDVHAEVCTVMALQPPFCAFRSRSSRESWLSRTTAAIKRSSGSCSTS